jgi:cell wall-associated NlpC family hydrolase
MGRGFSPAQLALVLAVGVFAMAAAGCASSPKEAPRPDARSKAVEKALRKETRRWQGTPHCLGGADLDCADCSGFVQAVFARLFDRALPRPASEQVLEGAPVEDDALLPGDLVFFRPGEKTWHVGIYLSRREFAHASKGQGVTVSGLDEPYWRRAFLTARRVLSGN